jgi:hypothetical protein
MTRLTKTRHRGTNTLAQKNSFIATLCNKDFQTYKSYEDVGKGPHCGSWITFTCKKCYQPVNAEAYLKNNRIQDNSVQSLKSVCNVVIDEQVLNKRGYSILSINLG